MYHRSEQQKETSEAAAAAGLPPVESAPPFPSVRDRVQQLERERSPAPSITLGTASPRLRPRTPPAEDAPAPAITAAVAVTAVAKAAQFDISTPVDPGARSRSVTPGLRRRIESLCHELEDVRESHMLEIAKVNAEKKEQEEKFRRQEQEMQEQRMQVENLRKDLDAALALIHAKQLSPSAPPASEPASTHGTSSSSGVPREPGFNVICKKHADFESIAGDSAMSDSHTSIDYHKLDGSEE